MFFSILTDISVEMFFLYGTSENYFFFNSNYLYIIELIQLILNFLFKDRGRVYVFDTGIMTMKYTFDFYLDDMEKAILNLPGIPPKPTGVGLEIVELPHTELFGFNGTGFQPFDQAPFRP